MISLILLLDGLHPLNMSSLRLRLCCVPIYKSILHLCLEGSQRYMSIIRVPKSLSSCLLVLVHMLLQPSLCFSSFHELVHTDVIRLLLEIASVLSGIKYLHDSEHSTHSRTQALCPLVTVSQHRNTAMLPSNCHSQIHLRKRSRCTVSEWITMLLTKCAQDLKGYRLSAIPRGSPLKIRSLALVLQCPCTSWDGHLHLIPWFLLHMLLCPEVLGRLCVPPQSALSRAKQACQKYPGTPIPFQWVMGCHL
jgi:hypothetical protein